MTAKRILVTGGAGFVGSHTVDALLAQGHEIRVFDNLTEQVHGEGPPSYLAKNIDFRLGDIRDINAVRSAVEDIDVVYHLAAAVGVGQSMYEIARYMEINTQGTANLLQALLDRKSKVERLIVASSMSIYGEGQYKCEEHGILAPSPRPALQLRDKDWEVHCSQCGRALKPVATAEDKPLQCASIYALSKKDQEEMVLLFGRTYDVPVVALRYFNIFGTRQALSNPYTGVAAIFGSRLLNRNAPMIFEDGEQKRDFVSVHDVVQANILAMENAEANGHALNIGSGEPITIRDVASIMSEQFEGAADQEITGRYRAGDIRHCYADISLARKVLGYSPRFGFRDGVGELIEWLRSQTAVDRVHEASQQLTSFGLTA
jgi:dTDP-L-rhamnose 4-epimerase